MVVDEVALFEAGLAVDVVEASAPVVAPLDGAVVVAATLLVVEGVELEAAVATT